MQRHHLTNKKNARDVETNLKSRRKHHEHKHTHATVKFDIDTKNRYPNPNNNLRSSSSHVELAPLRYIPKKMRHMISSNTNTHVKDKKPPQNDKKRSTMSNTKSSKTYSLSNHYFIIDDSKEKINSHVGHALPDSEDSSNLPDFADSNSQNASKQSEDANQKQLHKRGALSIPRLQLNNVTSKNTTADTPGSLADNYDFFRHSYSHSSSSDTSEESPRDIKGVEKKSNFDSH